MARYRTLQEWVDLTGDDALTDPERHLIACCQRGVPCVLGDGKRPEESDPDRTIRAELLRYLILGGSDDCRVDAVGVHLQGAYVRGVLDLAFATVAGATGLGNCTFTDPVVALQTRFQLLSFEGSKAPGLNAQGANVAGSVFLRSGFHSTGRVNFSGAKIGGQLECSRGRFANAKGDALYAQGAEITGSVFLRGGFHATGEVNFAGAKLGGQLSCTESCFENPGGRALMAQRLRVEAGFLWRDVIVRSGSIALDSARVSDLADDPQSWSGPDRLILNGFTYDRINGGFTDVAARLAWLAKGDHWNAEFFPQPYTQLAKVYREMGHERAARVVGMRQEQLMRQDARARGRVTPDGSVGVAFASLWADLRNGVLWCWDILLRFTVGYGRAPGGSLVVLTLLLLLATFIASRAWNEGSFAPNSDVMLVSDGWAGLADDPAVMNPAATWSAGGAPGQDWETFNRYAYGFDVVVPILTLGQTAAWAPSTNRGPWGVSSGGRDGFSPRQGGLSLRSVLPQSPGSSGGTSASAPSRAPRPVLPKAARDPPEAP